MTMDDQDQANRMRLLQEEEVRYEDNARKMNRLWRQQEIALHEEMIRHDEIIKSILIKAFALVAAYIDECSDGEDNEQGRPRGSITIKGQRPPEFDNFLRTMNERLFRRRYRMKKSSFFELLELLADHLPPDDSGANKRKRGKTPNGPITQALRLSMALRYFAGGDPLDIADRHMVGETEPLRSVWLIVEAIHEVPSLQIQFPASHEKQMQIAQGFKARSAIGIDSCVGAIDGILIWIHKPSAAFLKKFKVGPAKFFCGRKSKFGLNMQAVCDADGRFLDVYIGCPGSASDYYAFHGSPLRKTLEKDGFLSPGLCLFGDNAYLNSPYMLTGFRNVSKNSEVYKDGFNFYQSQLRINIECAFGRLVHRWGILRKPIPMNVGVDKTMHLLMTLCKLHNFCLNETQLPCTADEDVQSIFLRGGMLLPRIDQESTTNEALWDYNIEDDRLNGLLDGGEHGEDYDRTQLRNQQRYQFRREEHLPYKLLLSHVIENKYTRP